MFFIKSTGSYLISIILLLLNSCNINDPPKVSPMPIVDIPMDRFPDWSPTGEWIAYEHVSVDLKNDTSGIYIIRPDGTDKHLVIPGGYHPSWSPDGKKIAFSATTFDGQIWIYDLTNTTYKRLTNEGFNIEPAWSNNGGKIIYRSDQTLVMADTNGTLLLNTGFGGSFPSWSPIDDSICYNSNSVLTILSLDNMNITEYFVVNSPKWHPDASEITYDFYDYTLKESNIYIYDIVEDSVEKLNANGSFPSWSPSGDRIVYSSNIANKSVLFIINRDGSNIIQLTN